MSKIVNLSWWLVGGMRQGYMVPCYVIQTVRVQVLVGLGGGDDDAVDVGCGERPLGLFRLS